ncbi:HAD family hydrolase [Clostridium saccharobutylicum]|uniref:Putative phosphatase n=1 Tax=Clostridium saccharobutylicum TaxID=169679 RepID=A0A1S8ND20_CLOSA|nr:HAD family hydrolase [Clostridium saccharobutylicum]OOM14293.1 putative phosphatase [Clostridium saccharobutylicum]
MSKKFDGYVILSDLDGTLLDKNKNVSDENKRAIEYFIENGGKFSIATGRAIEASEQYIKDVKLDLPTIVYNGGMIYDYNEKKVIRENLINDKQKQLLSKIRCDYPNIGIEIYCERKVYVYNDSGMSNRPATSMLDVIYDMPSDLLQINWNKVILIGKIEEINYLEKNFRSQYGIEAIRSANFCCEILPLNTSKGQALKDLIEIYNLDKHKVIAVGDNMNDAELLDAATIAFCPENASKEVKEYADYITVDNENHVVHHIVKWIEENGNV